MTRYNFCMALLMTYADFHRKIGSSFAAFYDICWHLFDESDGLTCDDVEWCWNHPYKWVTSQVFEAIKDNTFDLNSLSLNA